ncbi:hypothetical protein CHARACLAT_015285, partial [Characodon lateralis]|nr:hypothetical protein [Characodon lateralis]
PVEVARASIPGASWTPSSGGVPGTSHREEAQVGHTGGLEGLCLSAGLGTPWAPPGGAGGGVWGDGRLGVSAESVAPATRSWIKRKTTSCELQNPSLPKATLIVTPAANNTNNTPPIPGSSHIISSIQVPPCFL